MLILGTKEKFKKKIEKNLNYPLLHYPKLTTINNFV